MARRERRRVRGGSLAWLDIDSIIVTARPLAGIQALAVAVAPHLPEING